MGAEAENGAAVRRLDAEENIMMASNAPAVDAHPLHHITQSLPQTKLPRLNRGSHPHEPVALPIKREEDGRRQNKEKAGWNTKNLGSRLFVDGASAAAAGGLIAPIVSMIDRAIMENASGKNTLGSSVLVSLKQLLFQPHRYLTTKPFALILMVYSSTYLAANALDTARATTDRKPASIVTSGPAKFAATSATNMGLGLYKDSQFTKMFGTAAARPIPPTSYALFALRDSLTIFASFNLPPILAPSLPLSEAMENYVSRASTAQFLAPAAVQLISTPLHLLGLDLYNRNGGTEMSDRLRKVRLDWMKSSLARMCRIVPAFGFGGVVNTRVRSSLMKPLE